MTGQRFAQYVRRLTRTNTTVYPDATLVLDANVVKDEIAGKILEAKEDAFVVPATRDLADNVREYNLPTDILNSLSKVEVKFSSTGEYIPLKEIDLNNLPFDIPHTESEIILHYANELKKAFYDLRRGALYIYSGTITTLVDGIRIWCSFFPQDVGSGDMVSGTDLSVPAATTSVAIPRMFHELWARGTSILYKSSKEKPIPLTERELKYDVDLEEKLSQYRLANTDREITASLPDTDRLQYA